MTDTRYKFWLDALAGKNPPAINEQAECGFYRMRRGTTWVPVAVYPTGAVLGFKFGREVVHPNMGVENWPRYCSNPITETVYRAVAEKGEQWPDADPVVEALLVGKSDRGPANPVQVATGDPVQDFGQPSPHPETDADFRPRILAAAPLALHTAIHIAGAYELDAFAAQFGLTRIGLTNAKIVDPTEEFREEISTALGGVPVYAKIESDETDVRALSLRNMLNELALNADKAREAAKKPHWDAAKAVDEVWQPLIKAAREGAAKIKAARDAWQDDKRKSAVEAQQRADEETAKLEAAAAKDDISAPPVEPVKPQSNLPPPSTSVKPTYGKASGTGTKMVVVDIDYDKFFAALKLRPEWGTVKAQFDEWAQKLANKGIIPDGVKAEERSNTR